MAEYYLWLKAFHIISFTCWMVGMFYLPRLYVYHADAEKGSDSDKMLQVMEHKLLRIIVNPAMVLTLIFGLSLASIPGIISHAGWFHAKSLLLILLFGFHGYLAKTRKTFSAGNNTKSARFYRILNEIPTLIFIAIVILAVIKPF